MSSATTADVAGNVSGRSIAVIGIRGLPANYGGLETCAEEVAHRWVREGNDVRVYCRKSRYSERPAEMDGVKLVYTWSINTKSLDTISHTFFSIVHLLFTGTCYKYVHLYNTGNAIFIPLLKLFGKKVVLSGDGIEWRREKWGAVAKMVHKTGERVAVLWADKIVVDNAEVGHYYTNKYQVDTAEIAYGANDLQADVVRTRELLEQYNLTAKQYFLFVGRLAPEKGVHNLIAAYKQLDTVWPLVIIGDDANGGEYRDNLFAQESDDVRFLGFVYDSDYEQLLLQAYLYISASELEGTSPSLVSAMGAGVCALVNGIEENVATTKDAACLYKKNSQQDLVHDWQQLIDEPDRAAEFAAKGRICVEQHYRWDAIAAQYLAVMSEIG